MTEFEVVRRVLLRRTTLSSAGAESVAREIVGELREIREEELAGLRAVHEEIGWEAIYDKQVGAYFNAVEKLLNPEGEDGKE